MKKCFSIKTTKTGWAARSLGTLLAVIYLFILITESIAEAGSTLIWQSYVMLAATIILIGGVILGWFREKSGGILLIIVSLAFSTWSYFEAGHNEWLAFLVSGFPFLVTGILFLLSSLVRPKSE